MDNAEFFDALEELSKEKGISPDIIFEAIEAALISSYKKNYGTNQNVIVNIDRDSGSIDIYAEYLIVDEIEDEATEISLEDARKIDHNYEVGETLRKNVTPSEFGRIAAQTAKQVVVQRLKDAERDVIYSNYVDKENELLTGIVQRVSKNIVYFDLGKTEAIMKPSEQIEGEKYNPGDRLKLYVGEVKKSPKGPQVFLSRTHPNLVKRLFELEVPEIQDGVVEIFSIAREAGSRTKIAVFSKDENVDPLGACVGFKGQRVNAIVDELANEKIDIVIWSKNIRQFIANSLSPSDVVEVVADIKEKSALVIVPDNQLSLAIGKEGQNARLAAKLTNWKIDIKSESQFDEYYESLSEEEEDYLNELMNLNSEELNREIKNFEAESIIEDSDELVAINYDDDDEVEIKDESNNETLTFNSEEDLDVVRNDDIDTIEEVEDEFSKSIDNDDIEKYFDEAKENGEN